MSEHKRQERRFIIEAEGFPDFPGMMLVTLEALKSLGGSATIQELDERVVEIENISEDEQSFLMPNGRERRLNYYLYWARTYLKRGKALENSTRGVWALTNFGETITDIGKVQAIHNQVNLEERDRARQKRKQENSKAVEKMQENDLESRFADDEVDWEATLLDVLLAMQPDAFERLAQRVLREAGFVRVEVRGKTGDGGIDGVGILRMNLVSFQVYFQCKRWKNNIGAKEIRDFCGALQGRADKGLFITTGSFTSQASEEATRDGAIAIDLIDGDRLCNLLKDFGLGVKTEMIEKVAVSDEWFQSI